jgi:hypothetical protein
MSAKLYRKITRPSRSSRDVFSPNVYQLAIGADHLLQICFSRYTYSESYKRFYFKDIQAFVMHQNQRFWVINLINGLLAALLLGFASLGLTVWRWDAVAFGTLFLFGFIPLIILIINLLLGPTCTCWISTAVHLEELPSIKRIRRARKVIEQLKPLLNETQGTFSADNLQQRQSEFETKLRTKVVLPTIRYDSGILHKIVFYMLVGNGILEGMDLAFNMTESDWVTGIWCVYALALLVLSIVAMIRQRLTNLPEQLKRITRFTVTFQLVGILVGFISFIYLGIQFGVDDMPMRHPLILVQTAIWMIVSLGLGMRGIVLLRRFLSNPEADHRVSS